MTRPAASHPRPSATALAAFGLHEPPVPLDGLDSSAWRVGDVVLKKLDIPLAQLDWQASLFDQLQGQTAFRIPLAVRSSDGSLVVDGWYALTFLTGQHEVGRWVDMSHAGEEFHAAVRSAPRPAFIDRREDPWSVGDRVAWDELPVSAVPDTKHLRRLADHLRPVEAQAQLIHGDLTGNVLLDDELPPAILDLSPYFRPQPLASAIIVADALVWEGADASLLHAFHNVDDFGQYLVRALIYRVVTDRLFRLDQPLRPDANDPYRLAVDLALTN